MKLTDEGRAIAHPTTPITSRQELHQAWYERLPRPQANILRAIIAGYPEALERPAVAEAVSQSPTSSSYANNLGALRSLELIDYPDSKHVVATELLFPAGVPA